MLGQGRLRQDGTRTRQRHDGALRGSEFSPPDLRLPEIVHQLGLVLFVYTLGLSAGPGFFASFRRRGLRDNGFGLAILLASAATAWALAQRG